MLFSFSASERDEYFQRHKELIKPFVNSWFRLTVSYQSTTQECFNAAQCFKCLKLCLGKGLPFAIGQAAFHL